MISVSCAAGYGKFTQTNDSHLPEARDTIEKERAREERRARKDKREEGGGGLCTGATISDNSIYMECLPFYLSNAFTGLQCK